MSIRVHRRSSNEDFEIHTDFLDANGWQILPDTEGMSVTQDDEVVATFARHCWSWVEDRDMTARGPA